MNNMTGYDLAKIASEKTGRNIRPQMVYNYMKKGYIQTVEVDGKVLVTIEGAVEFIKNQINGTSVDKEGRRAELSMQIDELLEG